MKKLIATLGIVGAAIAISAAVARIVILPVPTPIVKDYNSHLTYDQTTNLLAQIQITNGVCASFSFVQLPDGTGNIYVRLQ